MSVIHDALKTAQREKQSRAASPTGSPIIMPMGGRGGAPPFDWKNAATIAVASIVIVVAVGSLWFRMRPTPTRPLENVPVVMMPADISPAPSEATGPTDAPSSANTLATVERPPVSTPAVDPGVAPSRPVAAAATNPRTTSPATAADARVVQAEPREASQSGRLRIEVEQPREGDVARLFAAGVAAHRAGDLTAARSAYERVLAAVPNDVDALNNLGVVLAAVRELDRGEALLRRAVRLAPEHVGAWNNLGTVLVQRGQASDAIAAFQQAISLDPQHQGARVSLAQQHLAIGSPEKAREVLEAVVASNPAMPEAHYTLGQAFEMEKDWAGAVRAYSAFIRVAPPRLSAVVERVQQRVQMLSERVR
jgi:Tfp pilus assembly protein PilF